MKWQDDINEKGLPSPHGKEPLHLRQDILDELFDHLAFAAEREHEKGAENDSEIRQRVLERFGDPTTVARQLWFDAMKETIMRDWMQTIIMGVLCVAVVSFMAIFYRQMQTTNNALISSLQERAEPTENATLASVEFEFRYETENGPLADEIVVRIYGKFFDDGNSDSITEITGLDGMYRFGPMKPGTFRFTITDKASEFRMSTERVLFAGLKSELIIVPGSGTLKAREFDVNVPEIKSSLNVNQYAAFGLSEQVKLGLNEWSRGRTVMLVGDTLYETVYENRGVSAEFDGLYGISAAYNGFGASDLANVSVYDKGEAIRQVAGETVMLSRPRVIFRSNVDNVKEDDQIYYYPKDQAYDKLFDIKELRNWSYELSVESDKPDSIPLPNAFLDAFATYPHSVLNNIHSGQNLRSDLNLMLSRDYPNEVVTALQSVERSAAVSFNPEFGHSNQVDFNKSVTPMSSDHSFIYSVRNLSERKKNEKQYFVLAGQIKLLNETHVKLSAHAIYGESIFDDPQAIVGPGNVSDKPFWSIGTEKLFDKRYDNNNYVNLVIEIPTSVQTEELVGIMLRWDTPTTNSIMLSRPEADQNRRGRFLGPLHWMTMKPIETVLAASDTESADTGD